MIRKIVLGLAIALILNISVFSNPVHSIVELQIGSVIDKRVFDSISADMPNPAYSSIGVAYVYRFNNIFSLGGWLGYIHNGPPVPLAVGVKLIFGNKVEGFSFSLNLGLIPSIGISYKKFFINAMVGFVEGNLKYNAKTSSVENVSTAIPYIEIGYSIPIGPFR
ncbi:MAG: hypothetical protein GXP33_07860 [Spirochaetes bacterium]|nr:hypothetical protein [Spirochaetota bacterium]